MAKFFTDAVSFIIRTYPQNPPILSPSAFFRYIIPLGFFFQMGNKIFNAFWGATQMSIRALSNAAAYMSQNMGQQPIYINIPPEHTEERTPPRIPRRSHRLTRSEIEERVAGVFPQLKNKK